MTYMGKKKKQCEGRTPTYVVTCESCTVWLFLNCLVFPPTPNLVDFLLLFKSITEFFKGKFISGLSVYRIYGYFVISKNLETEIESCSQNHFKIFFEAVNVISLRIAGAAELYSTPTGLY